MKFAIIFALTLVAFAQFSRAAALPGSDEREDAVSDVKSQGDQESGDGSPVAGNDTQDSADSDNKDASSPSDSGDQSSNGVSDEVSSLQNGKPVSDFKAHLENYSSSKQVINGKVVDEHKGGLIVDDDNGKIKVTKLL